MRDRLAAIIFDFDGVLVHSEPLHEWAIRESVYPLGWEFSSEDFYRQIVGRGDENAYRRIAEWNRAPMPDDRLRELLTIKWGLMDRGIEAGKFEVQPGAAEAVRAAGALGPIGVCSGSVRRTVEPMLRRIGLLDVLGVLVCGDDVPNMKPAPDGYLLAAASLGVDPARCLAIEDTPTGRKAAKTAGMRVVAVCHTMEREMLVEADEVIASIAHLSFDAPTTCP